MSVMEEGHRRARRSFTDEFKADAVALVLDEDRKIVHVADSLGNGEGTLGKWVRQARIDRGERAGLSTSGRQELSELRRENAALRISRGKSVRWWQVGFSWGGRRRAGRGSGSSGSWEPDGDARGQNS